jgi:hypothetical protein
MARLASLAKAGYYPTPLAEVELICGRLQSRKGSRINALDPCCGEGIALQKMAGALDAESFGIELEEGRASAASDKLHNVICSDFEDAVVTPLSFSFLYLNPPYEYFGSERAEVVFLKELTDSRKGRLQVGGLLGFCIPVSTLQDAATLLASRFQGICVYRFTKENYAAYKQVVVFGYRRGARPDPDVFKSTCDWLKCLDDIPELDAGDGIAFTAPPARKDVVTFKPAVASRQEITEASDSSTLWTRAQECLPRTSAHGMKPLVLPLKDAHIAVAIAAGAVGGVMGDHILVGKSEKVVDVSIIPDEKGMKEVQTERVVTTVRVFAQDGYHNLEGGAC